MDIKTLLEDGTIHRAIQVLETNSIYSTALKKTIDSLHKAVMAERRYEELEVKFLEHSIEV